MRILIADKLHPAAMQALEADGFDVSLQPELTTDALPDAVGALDPDVLIVRSTKVPERVLEAGSRLSLIVRAGAGFDTIDVEAASQRGVFVSNCPGMNAIAVAELTWGLILACDRRICDQTVDLRAGVWKKKEYGQSPGLFNRTLGIIGLGTIGTEVARRGQAFGMNVLAWSRSLTEKKAQQIGVGFCSKLINLVKMSDVLTIHVAANDDTRHLVDKRFCQAMRPGAYLINTSRGNVMDQSAVIEAIRSKGIRVGLDVYADEPGGGEGTFADPIVNEPGVYGTHHIGASTDQAQEATALEAVRIIQNYRTCGQVPNCVNRALTTVATCQLTIRHLNRPGVLAHVFYTLGQAGINVEEMENIIYEGENAACARIQLSEQPNETAMHAITTNEHVISVHLMDIPSTSR